MPKNPNIQNMRKFMQITFPLSPSARLAIHIYTFISPEYAQFIPVFAQIPVNNPFFAQ